MKKNENLLKFGITHYGLKKLMELLVDVKDRKNEKLMKTNMSAELEYIVKKVKTIEKIAQKTEQNVKNLLRPSTFNGRCVS